MKFNTLEESIQYAIKQEEIAITLYTHLSSISTNLQAKEEFDRLVVMETEHKVNLQNYSWDEYKSRDDDEIYFDLKTSDYLVKPDDINNMSFLESIIVAAKREKQAMEMYQKFAEAYSKNEKLNSFFLQMVEEEARHKYELESLYEDLINER